MGVILPTVYLKHIEAHFSMTTSYEKLRKNKYVMEFLIFSCIYTRGIRAPKLDFCFTLKHLHAHDNELESMQILGESQIILHADTWRKPNQIAQV